MIRKTRERSGGKRDGKSRRGENARDKGRGMDAAGMKKRSHFLEGIKVIDGTDYEFLRKFVTEHGKIIPARLTGATATQQRKIRRAIRRARVMGLLP